MQNLTEHGSSFPDVGLPNEQDLPGGRGKAGRGIAVAQFLVELLDLTVLFGDLE